MSFALFDDKFYRSLKLRRAVKRAGNDAGMLWVCSVGFCNDHKTDGHVPDFEIANLTIMPSPEALARSVEALLAENLWHRAPENDGYLVHDYLQHNKSRKQIEAEIAETKARKKAWKDKRKKEGTEKGRVPNTSPGTNQGRGWDASGTLLDPIQSPPLLSDPIPSPPIVSGSDLDPRSGSEPAAPLTGLAAVRAKLITQAAEMRTAAAAMTPAPNPDRLATGESTHSGARLEAVPVRYAVDYVRGRPELVNGKWSQETRDVLKRQERYGRTVNLSTPDAWCIEARLWAGGERTAETVERCRWALDGVRLRRWNREQEPPAFGLHHAFGTNFDECVALGQEAAERAALRAAEAARPPEPEPPPPPEMTPEERAEEERIMAEVEADLLRNCPGLRPKSKIAAVP